MVTPTRFRLDSESGEMMVPLSYVSLNLRQNKIFKEWFETGNENYDMDHKTQYRFRDEFITELRNNNALDMITFNTHLSHSLIMPSDQSRQEMFMSLLSTTTEDATEDALETLCTYLYKFAIGKKNIDKFL